MTIDQILQNLKPLLFDIGQMPIDDRVDVINTLREMIHAISPFNTEPVDFVKWVKSPLVHANDYNPNSVAPQKWNCCAYLLVPMATHSQSFQCL